jgi:hypothetical protein
MSDSSPTSRFEKVTKHSGSPYDSVIYITIAALGLIVALAWRDAVHAFFVEHFKKNEADEVKANFIYAIIVTIAMIMIMYALAKYTRYS